MTTLLCGAGHAGPRPFMTIRSPALHPIKRCVVKAFGLATNQHYFGATGKSLLRGKSEGSLSGFCTYFLGHTHRYRGNPLGGLSFGGIRRR